MPTNSISKEECCEKCKKYCDENYKRFGQNQAFCPCHELPPPEKEKEIK